MKKTTYIQKWNILKDHLEKKRKNGNLILISEIQDIMGTIEFLNEGEY